MADNGISVKEQAAYLKDHNYWIGNRYSNKFVSNLYDLASRGLITAQQWGTYGDVSKSWDKQSRAILAIAAMPAPKEAKSVLDKASVLRLNGYWIDGKSVGKGVIDNLYSLYIDGNITAQEWNKYGIATRPWGKQSYKIISKMTMEPPAASISELEEIKEIPEKITSGSMQDETIGQSPADQGKQVELPIKTDDLPAESETTKTLSEIMGKEKLSAPPTHKSGPVE